MFLFCSLKLMVWSINDPIFCNISIHANYDWPDHSEIYTIRNTTILYCQRTQLNTKQPQIKSWSSGNDWLKIYQHSCQLRLTGSFGDLYDPKYDDSILPTNTAEHQTTANKKLVIGQWLTKNISAFMPTTTDRIIRRSIRSEIRRFYIANEHSWTPNNRK